MQGGLPTTRDGGKNNLGGQSAQNISSLHSEIVISKLLSFALFITPDKDNLAFRAFRMSDALSQLGHKYAGDGE